MILNNSPISQFEYKNRTFFVKRDDLLDKNFNGNKARKLACYLEHDFQEIDTIISYGGNQSNLMYSLSCLAKLKNWQKYKTLVYNRARTRENRKATPAWDCMGDWYRPINIRKMELRICVH